MNKLIFRANKNLRYRLAQFLSLGLLAFPAITHAQINIKAPNTRFTKLSDIISQGFTIVISVSGVIFVVLLLLGGVLYLVSAGNEDNAKKARQLILDAIIGIVIVATAWAVGNFVLQQLGIRPTGL